MAGTQSYKELLVQESKRKEELTLKHLKQLFGEVDVDDSGEISLAEMASWFEDDPRFKEYLAALEINPEDARALFDLLDQDDSGKICINEFCMGCLKLKGEARSFDVHFLLLEQRRLAIHAEMFRCEMLDKFKEINRKFVMLDKNITKGLMDTMNSLIHAIKSVHIAVQQAERKVSEEELGCARMLLELPEKPNSSSCGPGSGNAQVESEVSGKTSNSLTNSKVYKANVGGDKTRSETKKESSSAPEQALPKVLNPSDDLDDDERGFDEWIVRNPLTFFAFCLIPNFIYLFFWIAGSLEII